jgi:nicotinamidase-related amidase
MKDYLDHLLSDLNPNYLNVDPLKHEYHEAFIDNKSLQRAIVAHKTALMVIDMQYLDAARGFGVFKEPSHSGLPKEAEDYYFSTLENIVIPNIQKLLQAFRAVEMEVIHTRIQSISNNGRDRSPGHKRLGLHAPPNSKEAEFLEQVKPMGDEIIINKTASGVFTSTNLNYILTNMRIKGLFVTGVYTNECVSTTIRDACDLGYFVTLIEDACTTVTPQLQESTLTTLKDRYARVITTDQAIEELHQLLDHKAANKES